MFLHRAALVAALLLVPQLAAAQVKDADRATARALAEQGQAAFDKKDFATATDRFSRAVELVYAPTLALALARSEAAAGRLVGAQETYNRILREGAPAGAPPVFVKAIADARRELEALEPRVPSVVVTVAGAPAAKVTLDGAPFPKAALGVNRPVDPGSHTLRAEAEGFAPAEVTVTVAERKAVEVKLTLAPAAAPVRAVAPSIGAVPPDAPAAKPAGSARKTVGFVSIGVGGAALILGAATGAMALAKHGELAKICPAGMCENQQSAVDSYKLMGTLSTVGFVAGGVLAATGVVLVVTAPKSGAVVARWSPVLGPGYVGLTSTF